MPWDPRTIEIRNTREDAMPGWTHDDFYWDELPLDVLIRFDALPPPVQKLFVEDLKPDEDPRAYCKERIKRLKSAGWSIEDMVDLARVFPDGFGKFRTETWSVFAAILRELREERLAWRRSKQAPIALST